MRMNESERDRIIMPSHNLHLTTLYKMATLCKERICKEPADEEKNDKSAPKRGKKSGRVN